MPSRKEEVLLLSKYLLFSPAKRGIFFPVHSVIGSRKARLICQSLKLLPKIQFSIFLPNFTQCLDLFAVLYTDEC